MSNGTAVLFPGQYHSMGSDDDVADTDYVNASDVVMGVTMMFCTVSVLVVGIRLYTRTRLTHFRGADDWWILAALVFAIGDQVLKMLWCFHGLGVHIDDVPIEDSKFSVQIAYAIAINYPWALGLVKISILIFYVRVFPSYIFRRLCYISIGVVLALTIAVSVAQALACSPISEGWELATTAGKCVNKAALQYTASSLNLATDIIILLMPMKYLWRLSLDKYPKLQIIGLFALGLMACIASAARLSTIHAYYLGNDPTWDAYQIAIWSNIEINLAIITASIPAVKAWLIRYLWHPSKDLVSRKFSDSAGGAKGKTASTSYELGNVSRLASNATQNEPWMGSLKDRDESGEEKQKISSAGASGRYMDFKDFLRDEGSCSVGTSAHVVDLQEFLTAESPPSKDPGSNV